MQTNGRDIYVNIKELPLINEVQAGDFFIVETTAGTNIVDFSNIIIPPENTTFYGEIEQLQTDVDGLSTLYILQNTLIKTVSSTLDTKIDTTSAELTTQIENLSSRYYLDGWFVLGGGYWSPVNDGNTATGVRCTYIRNDVGNYTVIFDNNVAGCTVNSTADITNVTGILEGGAVQIETYNLSYTFDVSGGSSAFSAITAVETVLERVPVDVDFLSVIAF